MLRISLSTDLSTSTTQIAVEDDGVDGGSGKLVEKLSKVQKTSKAWRIYKGHQFGGTKLPDLRHSLTLD